MKKKVFLTLQHIAPQHWLSRLAGKLAESESPMLKNFLIQRAMSHFNISLEEAQRQNIDEYKSFNDFFTRTLQADARPLDINPDSIVSPADGMMTQSGDITEGQLIQAKGKTFSCSALLANTSDQDYGTFFTIYLSPRDYHRVHMPMDGTLTRMVYIPGKLFSVNEDTAEHIDQLFAKNERLVCYFDTAIGEIAVVFVGAMLVAGIVTTWHGIIAPTYQKKVRSWDYRERNMTFSKGDELGYFNFGSTVICLFPKDQVQMAQQEKSVKVKTMVAKTLK